MSTLETIIAVVLALNIFPTLLVVNLYKKGDDNILGRFLAGHFIQIIALVIVTFLFLIFLAVIS